MVFGLEKPLKMRYNILMVYKILTYGALLVVLAVSVQIVQKALAEGIKDCFDQGKQSIADCYAEYGHKVPQHWDDVWDGGIPILEPLSDGAPDTVDFGTGNEPAAALFNYLSSGWGTLLSVAFGIVMLWVMVCGGAIMLTGDPSKEWRGRMIAAIIGLLIVYFVGVILQLLNAAFFKP
ncbi:hypothetical protein KJ652_01655 [Patescibacteria group bacterium]|nr:hypothetical protein [Patescibacteria group bacterium]MBU1911144.1 hypothetical protein [Patescibacteria group bacterium]